MIVEMKIRYNCEEEYENTNCRNKKCKTPCYWTVVAIFAALFIGVIGIIIGAALSVVILAALPAIIVLAVILLLLLITNIILALCTKEKKKCCR